MFIDILQMCAQPTDSDFKELAARNYNKLSESTTKVRLLHFFISTHESGLRDIFIYKQCWCHHNTTVTTVDSLLYVRRVRSTSK